MEQSTFGAIVKERRQALGLTQAELARRVGCATVTIRRIEYNTLRPSVQIAEGLALALNLPEAEQISFVRLARASGEADDGKGENQTNLPGAGHGMNLSAQS
jgi:transcriptional regulator with XRE-family HTH domain